MNDDKFIPRMYFLMRLDIPDLNTGKAIAQATHAQCLADSALYGDDVYEAWRDEGGGFGTAISLECTMGDIEAIRNILLVEHRRRNSTQTDTSMTSCFGVVFDPTYPFSNTFGEIYTMELTTCAYVFVHEGTPQEIKDYLSGLRLYR